MLAVAAGIAGAIMAVPFAPWIEVHRKRPVMITADVVQFGALASVPLASSSKTVSTRCGYRSTT